MKKEKIIPVRDLRSKDWFKIDNKFLDLYGEILGVIGVGVYVCLCRHADKDQSCFPSQETISKKLGVSKRSVVRYLEKLVEFNIIKVDRGRTDNGKWLKNIYFLIDKSHWINPSAISALGEPSATGALTQVPQVHTNNTQREQYYLKDDVDKSTLTNLRHYFIDLCFKIRKFKPEIDYGRDYRMLKQRLAKYTPEHIKKIFEFYFEHNKSQTNDYAPSMAIALSKDTVNLWRIEVSKEPEFLIEEGAYVKDENGKIKRDNYGIPLREKIKKPNQKFIKLPD